MVLERERDDLALGSEYPWIIFGDGCFARVVAIKEEFDSENNEVIKMTLLPTIELEKIYNVALERMREGGTIIIRIPHEMLVTLNRHPAMTVYFCFQTFDGQDCPATSILKGKRNAEEIMNFKELIKIRDAKIAYLTERLWKAETNIHEYVKTYVSDIAAEMNASALSNQQNAGMAGAQIS